MQRSIISSTFMLMGILLTHPGAAKAAEALPPGVTRAPFGKTADGTPVDLYTLSAKKGFSVKIITYGGIVVELDTPDRFGKSANVVLGFDHLEQYLADQPYFGALIGRFANRIALGKFTLGGKEYHLPINNAPNSLHGGLKGLHRKVWSAEPLNTKEGPALRLHCQSPDGEEGYPGNFSATVLYVVTKKNELKIEYSATTDKATPVNLTNHSYFNLAGAGNGDILGHVMQINAKRFTPVDSTLIPTGVIAPVKDTPMDFTVPAVIGSRITQVEGGYDHNYVVAMVPSKKPVIIARVSEKESGRVMEVLTTEPGVQFYTGNFLDGTLKGNGGTYGKHAGFCLETQHFPDSPNRPNFPDTILKPGKRFQSTTIYRFSAK
jgi:aldose 1-epimerase